jgi:hypothetical protein
MDIAVILNIAVILSEVSRASAANAAEGSAVAFR